MDLSIECQKALEMVCSLYIAVIHAHMYSTHSLAQSLDNIHGYCTSAVIPRTMSELFPEEEKKEK